MSRFYFFCLCAFTFLFSSSCRKKETPVEVKEDPVFYFTGSIDGSAVSLKAGENDYYMYSSYGQDANNVYYFVGDLKQTNCTSCKNAIRFRINDYKVSAVNAPVVIDSSLVLQSYPLQLPGGSQSSYTINFKSYTASNTGSSVLTYDWDFGDGTTSADPNPVHTYTSSGNYSVCLKVTFSGGSNNSTTCRTVKIKNSSIGCSVNILGNASIFTGDAATLTASFGVPSPSASYQWSTGETTSSIVVSPSSMKSYSVVACRPDMGCCDSSKVTVFVNSSCCTADFDDYVDTLQTLNPYSLSNITVTWTDNAGVVYTSNNAQQPSSSYFQITSVQDYLKNQNNQPTKKLHLKFKCKVFNGANSRQIDNGDAVIAVSYK